MQIPNLISFRLRRGPEKRYRSNIEHLQEEFTKLWDISPDYPIYSRIVLNKQSDSPLQHEVTARIVDTQNSSQRCVVAYNNSYQIPSFFRPAKAQQSGSKNNELTIYQKEEPKAAPSDDFQLCASDRENAVRSSFCVLS